MNKGFFVHIMGGFAYVVSVIFIFNGENLPKDERIGIVFGFFMFQLFAGFLIGMSTEGKWHKERI